MTDFVCVYVCVVARAELKKQNIFCVSEFLALLVQKKICQNLDEISYKAIAKS